MLPKEFVFERKMGFSVPLDDWLKKADASQFSRYLPYESEVINGTYIDELVAGVKKGRTNASRLFSLMSLTPSLLSN